MVAPQNAQTNCVCKSVGCLLNSVGATYIRAGRQPCYNRLYHHSARCKCAYNNKGSSVVRWDNGFLTFFRTRIIVNCP